MPNFDDGPLGQKCFYYDGVNATTSNMYDALSNGMSSHHFRLTREQLVIIVENVYRCIKIHFKAIHYVIALPTSLLMVLWYGYVIQVPSQRKMCKSGSLKYLSKWYICNFCENGHL